MQATTPRISDRVPAREPNKYPESKANPTESVHVTISKANTVRNGAPVLEQHVNSTCAISLRRQPKMNRALPSCELALSKQQQTRRAIGRRNAQSSEPIGKLRPSQILPNLTAACKVH